VSTYAGHDMNYEYEDCDGRTGDGLRQRIATGKEAHHRWKKDVLKKVLTININRLPFFRTLLSSINF
jgi:hypothetical protein